MCKAAPIHHICCNKPLLRPPPDIKTPIYSICAHADVRKTGEDADAQPILALTPCTTVTRELPSFGPGKTRLQPLFYPLYCAACLARVGADPDHVIRDAERDNLLDLAGKVKAAADGCEEAVLLDDLVRVDGEVADRSHGEGKARDEGNGRGKDGSARQEQQQQQQQQQPWWVHRAWSLKSLIKSPRANKLQWAEAQLAPLRAADVAMVRDEAVAEFKRECAMLEELAVWVAYHGRGKSAVTNVGSRKRLREEEEDELEASLGL